MDTKIKTYGALNPQAIIDLFDMRARLAELMSTDIRPSLEHKIAACVWREAASILARTEFIGWDDKISNQDKAEIDRLRALVAHYNDGAEAQRECREQ